MREAGPTRQKVAVPLSGPTLGELKSDLAERGVDPESRVARLLVALKATEPDWIATVTFEVGPAGVVPVAVEVRSTRGEPVTRAVWDRVRVGQVIDDAVATAKWLGPVVRRATEVSNVDWKAAKRRGRPGRPPDYSDEHYRLVADAYNAAEVAPVRSVAKAFEGRFPGLTDANDRRARSWVREARRRGYIVDRPAPGRENTGEEGGKDAHAE